MKLKNKGFTLTELIIAIVVIGILAIVSVNIYRALIFKAVATEGKTLMGTVARAQKTYWIEYGRFYGYGGEADSATDPNYHPQTDAITTGDWQPRGYDPILGIDARGNKYFRDVTFLSATDTGLYAESRVKDKPYKDLTVVLTINMLENGGKPNITLYKFDETLTPIDED